MAEEIKNLDVKEQESAKASKKSKDVAKKPNIFSRGWKAIKKFLSDTKGELKKVVWTPKHELVKNSKLVIVTVIVVGIAIAAVDFASSFIVNTLAGWFSIG